MPLPVTGRFFDLQVSGAVLQTYGRFPCLYKQPAHSFVNLPINGLYLCLLTRRRHRQVVAHELPPVAAYRLPCLPNEAPAAAGGAEFRFPLFPMAFKHTG